MHIILLTHANELNKPTNTGRLALTLPDIRVSQIIWQRTEPNDALLKYIAQGRTGLLYPEVLDGQTQLVAPTALEHFIVLDGTWQEARKMYNRSPYLHALPRVVLPCLPASQFHLRRNQREQGVCTAEALIGLLHAEGHHNAANTLDTRFQAFIAPVHLSNKA